MSAKKIGDLSVEEIFDAVERGPQATRPTMGRVNGWRRGPLCFKHLAVEPCAQCTPGGGQQNPSNDGRGY